MAQQWQADSSMETEIGTKIIPGDLEYNDHGEASYQQHVSVHVFSRSPDLTWMSKKDCLLAGRESLPYERRLCLFSKHIGDR